MVAASHQPRVVGLSGGWSGSSADGADALAVGSEDGDTVVLRIANWRGTPLQFSLAVDWLGSSGSDGGGGGAPEQPLHVHGALRVHTEMLRGVRGEPGEQNTPGNASVVAPQNLGVRPFQQGMEFELPHLSFTVITLTGLNGIAGLNGRAQHQA